jgi:hypothetical protein
LFLKKFLQLAQKGIVRVQLDLATLHGLDQNIESSFLLGVSLRFEGGLKEFPAFSVLAQKLL